MRFKLYREYGALNSPQVFDAVEQGLKNSGHQVVLQNEDVSVIWSVLWQGRMMGNQKIYQECQRLNRPIIIIEVGNLKRGVTWRVCLGHINGLGEFASEDNLDIERPKKLGVSLAPFQSHRRPEILVAAQHQYSLQWQGQQTMSKWALDIVTKIRSYTNRKIIVRPHPRSPFRIESVGVTMELPKKIQGSYDDFDIDYNYHCVINHNSGPAIQAAINGVPIICDNTSLAFPVSEKISNIENINLPDRQEWFLKLCHTEWTIDEIKEGIPFVRLITKILG